MSQASAGIFGYTTNGGGSDNESARMSNVQPYKYNQVNATSGRIRKVSPSGQLNPFEYRDSLSINK